ncbi:MAG: C2H2-type zinc finger protein [Candidatus Helarchaeota archaeon]
MTKSQRRKTKLEGRPEWVSSKKRCEECGAPLVFVRQTTYICTECGLIQEHAKHKKKRKAKSTTEKPDSGPYICPTCKKEFTTREVLKLHWKWTGHANHAIECSQCHKKFASSEALANHQRTLHHYK